MSKFGDLLSGKKSDAAPEATAEPVVAPPAPKAESKPVPKKTTIGLKP